MFLVILGYYEVLNTIHKVTFYHLFNGVLVCDNSKRKET